MNPDKTPDKAAVLIIGNEILAGRTQDTNTPWIAGRLPAHGIVLAEVRVVPDEYDAIIAALNALREKFDYVFATGGIGPTHDDITAEAVARAFGVKLERNADAFAILEKYYGIEELTPPRAKMAQIPRGAGLIPNPVSAAPGFVIENVYIMAGVPRIMQAMFDYILQTIKAGAPILSSTVTCGLPESVVAQGLSELQDRYPQLQLGSYPHFRVGTSGLSLVLRGTNARALEDATVELVALIKKSGGEPRVA